MTYFDSWLPSFRERVKRTVELKLFFGMGSLWAKRLAVDFEQQGSGANSKAPLR